MHFHRLLLFVTLQWSTLTTVKSADIEVHCSAYTDGCPAVTRVVVDGNAVNGRRCQGGRLAHLEFRFRNKADGRITYSKSVPYDASNCCYESRSADAYARCVSRDEANTFTYELIFTANRSTHSEQYLTVSTDCYPPHPFTVDHSSCDRIPVREAGKCADVQVHCSAFTDGSWATATAIVDRGAFNRSNCRLQFRLADKATDRTMAYKDIEYKANGGCGGTDPRDSDMHVRCVEQDGPDRLTLELKFKADQKAHSRQYLAANGSCGSSRHTVDYSSCNPIPFRKVTEEQVDKGASCTFGYAGFLTIYLLTVASFVLVIVLWKKHLCCFRKRTGHRASHENGSHTVDIESPSLLSNGRVDND